MRLARRIGLVLLVLMFITSCAAFQKAKEQPYNTWSAKKKLTHAINTYSREYDKYMNAAITADLNPGQRTYLQNKRKVLVALDKLIEVLIPIVEGGGTISGELDAQLLDYLIQLGFQPM